MNARTGVISCALALMAVSSLLLAGCGEQPQAAGDAGAQKQFLEERQGTPDPNFTPVKGMGGPVQLFAGPGGPGGPGAFGTVQKVEGRTLTLNNPMDGSTKVVHLADDAKVTTQVDANISDLKVGDNITAIGKLEGDTLTASSIQIGGEGATEPGSVVGPREGGKNGPGNNVVTFDNGTTGTPQPPMVMMNGTPGPMPDGANSAISETAQIAIGSVEKIDGQVVSIKDAEGKASTVQLSDTTQINKEAELDPAKIEIGMTLAANGEQKGDVFEATSAQILPALRVVRP